MIKAPLIGSERVLAEIQRALGPDRKPLLIAIDGADDLGKSSLASWFAWQLGMPSVHLDLYLIRDSCPLQWITDELARIISVRIERDAQPIIVEGVFVLDILKRIARKPDFLIYLRGEGGHGLSRLLEDYRSRWKPETVAHACLDGFVE